MITPDTKNWTWVLERACPECGYDTATWPRETLSDQVRANVVQWRDLLDRGSIAAGADDRTRWSTLEYAAHVRDVYRIFIVRLRSMLEWDDPAFENWDQDETALAERYNEQDPATVVAELDAAGVSLAGQIDAISGDQWQRPGRRSDGSRFTVESLLRYLVHDPVHHIWDVSGEPAPVSA